MTRTLAGVVRTCNQAIFSVKGAVLPLEVEIFDPLPAANLKIKRSNFRALNSCNTGTCDTEVLSMKMSACGTKRTFLISQKRSVVPPKADINSSRENDRF